MIVMSLIISFITFSAVTATEDNIKNLQIVFTVVILHRILLVLFIFLRSAACDIQSDIVFLGFYSCKSYSCVCLGKPVFNTRKYAHIETENGKISKQFFVIAGYRYDCSFRRMRTPMNGRVFDTLTF